MIPPAFRFNPDEPEPKEIHMYISRAAWYRLKQLLPDKGDIQALLGHAVKYLLTETETLPANGKSYAAEFLTHIKRIQSPVEPGLRGDAVCIPDRTPAGPAVRRTDSTIPDRNPGKGRQPSKAPSGGQAGE